MCLLRRRSHKKRSPQPAHFKSAHWLRALRIPRPLGVAAPSGCFTEPCYPIATRHQRQSAIVSHGQFRRSPSTYSSRREPARRSVQNSWQISFPDRPSAHGKGAAGEEARERSLHPVNDAIEAPPSGFRPPSPARGEATRYAASLPNCVQPKRSTASDSLPIQQFRSDEAR